MPITSAITGVSASQKFSGGTCIRAFSTYTSLSLFQSALIPQGAKFRYVTTHDRWPAVGSPGL